MVRFILCFLLCVIGFAQDPSDPDKSKPSVNTDTLITKPERTVEFTTDEGTWMGIDASPDGRTLLVDLLGDLYTLPVTGGELQPLASGMQWDYQARYSPDGKQIAFISDRNGSDNIWIMNADGSSPRALTKEKKFMFGSPTWSPDGEYIVARRYGVYPFDSYLRQSQLWMFQRDGGTGIQLTKGDPKYTRTSGPAFSPDGKFLYFSAASGRFNYNTDLAKWEVHRLNRETGEIDAITSTYGGGLRPLISPDGKTLLYGTRHDSLTGLRMRNLENRSEQWLTRRITRDDQEGFSAEDTLPGYAFSRDGKSVFILIDGKIHRIGVAGHEDSVVPFTAHVKRELGALAKFDDRITEDPLNVKQMRWLQSTPDGSQIVFSALGKIWIASPGATPRRLTSAKDREYAPQISPDGKSLVWVTWNDKDGGHLWKSDLAGNTPVSLSQSPAFYAVPEWSPDGNRIAFIMGSATGWLEEDRSDVYELKLIASGGGAITSVTHLRSPNSNVTWSADGKRLYYDEVNTPPPTPGPTDAGPTTSLVSIRADGVDKKTHIKFSALVSAVPSPDEHWMLLMRNADAYLAPLPRGTTEPITLNMDTPAVPLKQVTTTGALYGRWLRDSSGFSYAFTNHLYRISREDISKSAKPAELKPAVTQVSLT
ncbi:MAG: hypothetical protein M3Z85_08250, partial [Acidobacteriota bacterium]|nr:hypothetical protein [Acidobacteriota bacterium]